MFQLSCPFPHDQTETEKAVTNRGREDAAIRKPAEPGAAEPTASKYILHWLFPHGQAETDGATADARYAIAAFSQPVVLYIVAPTTTTHDDVCFYNHVLFLILRRKPKPIQIP
jgi:hypothetical protein